MILILTQCFPTRIGGIESLISNLALSLSNREKIIVLADQYDVINDALFDKENKNKFLIQRIGGLKFFRKRKKIKKAKFLIKTKNIKFIIGDSWKSLELCVDYLNIKNIPSLCLAHGNELISNKKGKIK